MKWVVPGNGRIRAKIGPDHAGNRRRRTQLEALPGLFCKPHTDLAVGQFEIALVGSGQPLRYSNFRFRTHGDQGLVK